MFHDPNKVGYLFIFPSMLIFTVFVFVPLIVSGIFSVFDFDMMGNNIQFIGINNYLRLFGDERFWNSLFNTLYYAIGTVPLQIIMSLLVAMAVSRRSFFTTFCRSIFFLPAIGSMTIISIIWTFLLDNNIGIIAHYLNLLGIHTIAWLQDPVWAMPTIMVVSVWKSFGFNMVIILAGLLGIPESYYESASIDGAKKITQFFKITLPMLIPTLGFVLITSIISSFQVFDQVFVMTQGGPLFKTETMVQYIYHVGFEGFEMGYASSLAEILFIIILIFSVTMFKRLRQDEQSY
ncbi:MAG TPA: sugar ABC transporter permease [Firmicutes bacterium]|nr:sugar ABC transporter permease [Bacillota bacterium]